MGSGQQIVPSEAFNLSVVFEPFGFDHPFLLLICSLPLIHPPSSVRPLLLTHLLPSIHVCMHLSPFYVATIMDHMMCGPFVVFPTVWWSGGDTMLHLSPMQRVCFD
jgi:hypothetical protein